MKSSFSVFFFISAWTFIVFNFIHRRESTKQTWHTLPFRHFIYNWIFLVHGDRKICDRNKDINTNANIYFQYKTIKLFKTSLEPLIIMHFYLVKR